MKIKLAVLLCSTFALLSACATKPYVPTLYDAQTNPVNSIALMDDAILAKLKANDVATATGSGAASGGLIGALTIAAIEGAASASRENNLAKILEPTGFDAETIFETMLQAKLKEAGYGDVAIIGPEKRKKRSKDYKYPQTSADAVLDVTTSNFGVQKGGYGQEWHPAAGVVVKLVSSSDNTVLMENIISYNSGYGGGMVKEGVITLFPEPSSNGFTSVKKIEAEPIVIEFNEMLDKITTEIVSLLK